MAWKVKRRERYALIEVDEVNPLVHRGTFHIGPRHVKHHVTKEFVEYAYVENPDFASERDCRVFAQSSNIAVEVYDFYNKLFDPDYENVSVYDERFEVQYLFKETPKEQWRSVDYYNPRIEVIPLEDGVDIKKTFDTDYGADTLEITYTIRTGRRLKHTIAFINKMPGQKTFRVIMKLAGIASDKVKHRQGEEKITAEKHLITPFIFFGEDSQHLKLSEYLWSLGETDEETGEWSPTTLKDIVLDAHAQGCKADIIIGNYVLTENESLLIDPDSDTWNISQSSDDCYRRLFASTFSLDANYQFAGGRWTGATRGYGGGMRYQNITIPKGSDITNATLTFTAQTSDSATVVNVRISAEAINDAPTFADSASAFDARWANRTAARVEWNGIGPWTVTNPYVSPNIASVIEEITDRAGWASGQDIVIFSDDFELRSTGDGSVRRGYAFDGAGAAVVLAVTWTPPPTSASEDFPAGFIVRHPASEDLAAKFSIRRTASPLEVPGEFVVRRSLTHNLGAELVVRHPDSGDLAAELIVRQVGSQDLIRTHFDIRYRRILGESWQRKLCFIDPYYWRAYYSQALDSLIFEYIHKTGLSGNVWTENTNARIDASGFDADALEADFSMRGSHDVDLPRTLIYSDGRDVWVAESDESSVLGWAWQNLTKVFDATAPDWYRYVGVFADRRTPIHRLFAVAVYYDDAPGAVQYVRFKQQTTPGDITGWDAVEDVSNTANTDKILGVAGRSMGTTGVIKKEVIVVWKEGVAIRSRYHTDAGHFEAIQDVDTTAEPEKTVACFGIEHTAVAADKVLHIIYIDADGSVRAAERESGTASVWQDFVTLDASVSEHENVALVKTDSIMFFLWQDDHDIGYRQHRVNPDTWWPALADPYNEFEPDSEAVVTTTGPPDQIQGPGDLPAGEAVAINWIGTIASAAAIGWGILVPATNISLPAAFTVRQPGSANLAAGFVVRHPASEDLAAKFSIRRSSSVDLPCSFEVGQGSEDLLGELIVRPSGLQDLGAGFIVRQAESTDLLGELIVRHPDSGDLPGQFIVRPSGLQDLGAGLIVRQAESQDLAASFDGQVSLNLPGEFSARRSWSLELGAGFVVAQGSQSLAAEFIVSPTGSANLLGTINVVHFLTLGGEFEVRSSNSNNLAAELIVRHPGSEDLAAAFSVFARTSTDLLGGFISRVSVIAPVDGVLIAYDPRPFFNYEVDVGTGFIGGIKEGSDTIRKAAGEASMKVATRYEAKRNDSITFGWKYHYQSISTEPTGRSLGAGFFVLGQDFKELAASFEVGTPSVQTFVLTFPWVYGPVTVTPGTSWTTVLEASWGTVEEMDQFTFHWDAMIRNALPGTYFAVKMTVQHDGEAKQTLGFEIGSRPAGGWSVDTLAAGIFPMSFTRDHSIAIGDPLTPFTVRVEVYANPGGLDLMWQTLTGTFVRM